MVQAYDALVSEVFDCEGMHCWHPVALFSPAA